MLLVERIQPTCTQKVTARVCIILRADHRLSHKETQDVPSVHHNLILDKTGKEKNRGGGRDAFDTIVRRNHSEIKEIWIWESGQKRKKKKADAGKTKRQALRKRRKADGELSGASRRDRRETIKSQNTPITNQRLEEEVGNQEAEQAQPRDHLYRHA